MNRRPATPEEAKALAHPLRLRILRLALDQSLTNKQLAERLGRDPGTVLHHVRQLVRTGFLAPDEVRQGEKGALEKPYRATGKSWSLSLDESDVTESTASQAMLEAFLAELAEAGPDAATGFSRVALTPGHQPGGVGQQPAVTAPPQRLRAHGRRRGGRRLGQQPVQGRPERRRAHVVGVAPEGRVGQCR